MKLPKDDAKISRATEIAFLACLCGIVTGCSKDAAETAARPDGQAAGAQPGSVTITPAQEAAKKRGMEQGPAVAAAIAAARGKKQ